VVNVFVGGKETLQSSLDGIVGMSLGRAEANAAGLAGEEVAAMGTALSDNVEIELYPALKLTEPTLTFLVLLSVSHADVS
jgi:hypothetical protein